MEISRKTTSETNFIRKHKDFTLESFICIWLHAGEGYTEENHQVFQKICSLINRREIFNDIDSCLGYIKLIVKEKIVLIISGERGSEIIRFIHHLPQFIAAYIFSEDPKVKNRCYRNYSKVSHASLSMKHLVMILIQLY